MKQNNKTLDKLKQKQRTVSNTVAESSATVNIRNGSEKRKMEHELRAFI